MNLKYHLLSGIILAAGVLIGLGLLGAGFENLLFVDGYDEATINPDQAGIVYILSTRHITPQLSAIAQLIGGAAIIAGTLALLRRLRPILKLSGLEPSDLQPSEQVPTETNLSVPQG